jgi:DNA invertase Pin-like site-specific DNA recombinase
MPVGSARVSTAEPHPDLERDARTQAGRGRLLTDTAHGAKPERPGLTQALNDRREGDGLAVWELDRLAASRTRGTPAEAAAADRA